MERQETDHRCDAEEPHQHDLLMVLLSIEEDVEYIGEVQRRGKVSILFEHEVSGLHMDRQSTEPHILDHTGIRIVRGHPLIPLIGSPDTENLGEPFKREGVWYRSQAEH